MHIIITDAWMAKSRPVNLSGAKLVLAGLLASLVLMLGALGMYHWVFLKGAREGWPIVGSLIKLVVRDEFAQRDRFMRENLDAMAKKVGEMQAKIVQLEVLTERVSNLAGVPVPDSAKVAAGRGGALVSGRALELDELQAILKDMERISDHKVDLLTVMESRLADQRIAKLLVPTAQPVPGSNVGSPFGYRIDPFTGGSAMHTGLDFQAETGTPILAAAGGVVVTLEAHNAYGNMVEVDHGNNLITRYAHTSKFSVAKGEIVKRGQKIAEVGSSGRSTGPHLHFEVLVQGAAADPQKFLTAGENLPSPVAVMTKPRKR